MCLCVYVVYVIMFLLGGLTLGANLPEANPISSKQCKFIKSKWIMLFFTSLRIHTMMNISPATDLSIALFSLESLHRYMQVCLYLRHFTLYKHHIQIFQETVVCIGNCFVTMYNHSGGFFCLYMLIY